MLYIKNNTNAILMAIFMALCSSQYVLAESRVYTINADDWARPRSGVSLIEYKALQQLMQDWANVSEGIIEIRFPGGEMGNLWAGELQDWLVALGIASENIRLFPGGAGIDSIDLVIKAER